MKGKFPIFLLSVLMSLTNSQAKILNNRKQKEKPESPVQLPMMESSQNSVKKSSNPDTPHFVTEFIPKPNSPPEMEKITIPMTPPSDPTVPKRKQTTQFSRPYNQKLITAVKFSSNPEDPHKGVVFSPLEIGSVLSSMEGRVVAVDYMDGYENYVIIEHSNGFFTVYGNLDGVFVAEGQKVKKGEVLGNLVKEKGLYFQVTQGKKNLDPLSLIKS